MQKKESHLEQLTEATYGKQRDTKDVFRLIAGFAALLATASMAEKIVDAQAVPFDDAVNAITESGTNDPSGAQITRGLLPHRFKLTFSGLEPETFSNTIFAGEYEVDDSSNGPDDGIVIRRLGHVAKIPNTENAATYFEIDRGDGRRTPIWANYFEIHDGTAAKWSTDVSCPATVAAIHPSGVSNVLKIVAGPFDVPAWVGTERGYYDVWRRPRMDVNFCGAIQESIDGAADPYAGLLNAVESTADDEVSAPEAGKLLAVTGADLEGTQSVHLLARDEETGELKHLQRNSDGTWIFEPLQNGESDSIGEVVWSMSKQITPGGREIILFALKDRRPDTFEPTLATLAIEQTGSNCFSEVKITMESSDAEPDDDKDGRVNSVDGCIGRANNLPNVDLAGTEGPDTPDGQEDECQTRCENGWPMVLPPEGATAEDFWDCESELGFLHSKTRGDGSSIHSTGELVRDADGAFLVQPGKRIRWMHTPAAQYIGPELSNPVFRIQSGNSARYRIVSAKHPDGRDSTLVFTHRPFGSQSVVKPLSASTDWQESGGVGDGDTLESVTGSFEIEVRNENFVPPAPDGGENATDGGELAGGGADGGESEIDAGEGNTADAGESADDAGGNIADAGGNIADGGEANGGGSTVVDDDASQKDNPDQDIKSGGCGCDITGTQEQKAAAEFLPLSFVIALWVKIRRRIKS